MAKFDSTILPQTNDPKEIQKMGLDLLDKLNQLATAQGNAVTGGPFVPLLPNPLIAGEPSLGTPHFRSKQSVAALLTQVPVANTWYTVTFTGQPAGTKGLWVNCIVFSSAVSGAMGLYWRPYNNGDTVAQSLSRQICWGPVAGAYGSAGTIVVPDSSGRVDFGCGNGGAGSTFFVYDWDYYWT